MKTKAFLQYFNGLAVGVAVGGGWLVLRGIFFFFFNKGGSYLRLF